MRAGGTGCAPPLVKAVVRKVHVPAIYRIQYVLRPRHEQPYDRAALLAHAPKYPLGLNPLEEDGLAAHKETSEPVHLCAGVIQRRDAEENVVLRLPVVLLLHLARMHQATVAEYYGLREPGRAGREVYRRVVPLMQRDVGSLRRAVPHHRLVAHVEAWAVVADIHAELDLREPVDYLLHAPGEFRPVDKHVGIGEVKAVLYLLCGVAEIQRHSHASGLEHAKVYRQPLKAVHEQDRDLVAAPEPTAQKEVGEAVRLLVELRPGYLAPERLERAGLYERVLAPRGVALLEFLRIDLDERNVVRPLAGVALKYFRYRFHVCEPSPVSFSPLSRRRTPPCRRSGRSCGLRRRGPDCVSRPAR